MFVAREEKARGGLRYFVDTYRCADCERIQERLVVNPQSVAEVEARRALRSMKSQAGRMLGYAVCAGMVARPDSCERCGRQDEVEGHHYDYARPLEVEWLCPTCHRTADKARRSSERAA